MNQPSGGPFDTNTVVCPIHGLRYDPAASPNGCIRCRASVRPAATGGSGAHTKVLAALLAALVVAGIGWLGYDRFATAKPVARRFTEQQLLEEVRRVRVVIYSATWCPSCDAAKSFLWKNSVPFEEHDIDKEREARERWVTLNPEKTIPVIDIEGDVVVGADPAPVVRALLAAAERHLAAATPVSE